jgi:hypothetical protein
VRRDVLAPLSSVQLASVAFDCATLAPSDATLAIITDNSSPAKAFDALTAAAFDFVFSTAAVYTAAGNTFIAPFVVVINTISTATTSVVSGTILAAITISCVAKIS